MTCAALESVLQTVGNGKPRPVYGALITPRSAYAEHKVLKLESGKPVFGASTHINVVGWPSERKCQRKIAAKLGKASKPVALATPINPDVLRRLLSRLRKDRRKNSAP